MQLRLATALHWWEECSVTQCRLRTGDGDEVLALDELEERLRTGEIPASAWIDVEGLTNGFVRLRDSPFASRWDSVARARFRGAFALDRVPLIVLGVSAVCVLLHALAEARADGPVTRDVLIMMGARARSAILWDGETWRPS